MGDDLCINLGAGEMPILGYVGIDAHPYSGVDRVMRFPPITYPDGSVAHIYCGHCLEHIPPWDVLPLLTECARVLRPGGTLTVVLPDADKARLLAESGTMTVERYALIVGGATYDDMPHWGLWSPARLVQALIRAGFQINDAYIWRDDARVFDRRALAQCGAQGVRV